MFSLLFSDKDNLAEQVKNQPKVSNIMVARSNNKLKQLNLNPLSVAKYFYEKLGEKGVEQTFLQPITYLACQEILKKENLLLFSEKFQTGPAGPVLLSLRDIIRKHGDHLDTFFFQTPDITNSRVLSHLEKLVKKHANSFGFEVQYQAQKMSDLTI